MTERTETEPLTGTRRSWCIRAVFLQRRSSYSFEDAARRLGVPRVRLRERIESGECECDRQPNGAYRFTWSQLAFVATCIWPMAIIERELGEDADKVLPYLIRSHQMTVTLPLYQARMLETLARRSGVDPSTYLSTHLLDLAGAHADELEEEIAGFKDALAFPSDDG